VFRGGMTLFRAGMNGWGVCLFPANVLSWTPCFSQEKDNIDILGA
jgi:hypothetical protein